MKDDLIEQGSIIGHSRTRIVACRDQPTSTVMTHGTSRADWVGVANRRWIGHELEEPLALCQGLFVAAVDLAIADIGRRFSLLGHFPRLASEIRSCRLKDGLLKAKGDVPTGIDPLGGHVAIGNTQ